MVPGGSIRLFWLAAAIAAVVAGVGGAGGRLAVAGEEPPAASSAGGGAEAVTNEWCPVLPDELTDPDIWVEYKGKRVYFCCQKCKHKFLRDPEKYVANLAAFSAPPAEGLPAAAAALLTDDSSSSDKASDAGASSGGRGGEHASEADEDRDHGGGLPKVLKWLGKFHMASVNFPVGLLVAGALAELLLMVTKRASYASAARFCVWIGGLGALVAGVLGWFHAGLQVMQDDWLTATHRWLGTLTAITALAALILSESHWRKPDMPARTHRYRVALFLAAVFVTGAGFFGGALVYGIDHYGW